MCFIQCCNWFNSWAYVKAIVPSFSFLYVNLYIVIWYFWILLDKQVGSEVLVRILVPVLWDHKINTILFRKHSRPSFCGLIKFYKGLAFRSEILGFEIWMPKAVASTTLWDFTPFVCVCNGMQNTFILDEWLLFLTWCLVNLQKSPIKDLWKVRHTVDKYKEKTIDA